MTPWYIRHVKTLHRLFWFVVGAVVLTVVAAGLFGVATDPSGISKTYSPADTLRNFPTIFPSLLRSYFGPSAQILFWVAASVLPFVAIFWFLGLGTTKTIKPGELGVKFSDVRGQPEIVDSVRQVMSIFQGHRDFMKHFGGYPPRGILFEGPPGTGKTLLAKAIAGETGVPFLSASGAGFANMFLGVPQMKVRRTFKKARKFSERWGGCVIFLDELDSIGGSRSGVSHASTALTPLEARIASRVTNFVVPGFGGGDSMLVNALLTEMDGMDHPGFLMGFIRRIFHIRTSTTAHNILVIGATNRAQTLDPALLRPGRFDRKIHIGLPGEDGRRDIIAYYLAKVAHIPIDIDRLAKATAGYSPARIKTIINEALIFAHRNGRDALTYDDIWQAKLHDEIGIVEPVVYSDTEKRITAIHESGHAVAMHFLEPNHPVQIVTIRKRGSALGLVHSQDDEERYSRQREEILADIKVSLAGMVAEEIWLGQSSTGPSSDLRAATLNAVAMVGHYGMGSSLVSHVLLEGRSMADDPVTLALHDPKLRDEVDAILKQCKTEVRALLEEHRQAVEVTRDGLLEKEEMTGDEFRQRLYDHGLIPKPPAVLLALPIQPPPGPGQPEVNITEQAWGQPAARSGEG